MAADWASVLPSSVPTWALAVQVPRMAWPPVQSPPLVKAPYEPLSALLSDSLWSLIHHRKAGNLCNAYSFFFRDSHPRCWFEFL